MRSQIKSKGEYGRLRYGKKSGREGIEESDPKLGGDVLTTYEKKKSRSREDRRCKRKRLTWIEEAGFSIVAPSDLDNSIPVLYVRTSVREAGTDKYPSQWYAIPSPQDLEVGKKHERNQYPSLSPVFGKMPWDVPQNCVTVVLLSRIYLLGGACYGRLRRPSRHVFSYDISAPHKGWEKRPNLICARYCPYTIALDGKIYVFGGMDYMAPDNVPYAEVYDPELDRWEALFWGGSLIRYVSPGHVVFMDQYGTKNILVRTNCCDSFYTYNTSANSFTLRERVPMNYWGEAGAVVDNILYIYHEDGIIAYDLIKAEWFHEPVHGLSEGTELPIYYCAQTPFLLHIGNKRLCIIYAYVEEFKDPQDMILTCSILRMIRRRTYGGKATLHASLESFRRYIVPGRHLHECLVL